MRENVFTIFAKNLNLFSEHRINKMEFYELFADLLEISNQLERNEKEHLQEQIKSKKDFVNFYHEAKQLL